MKKNYSSFDINEGKKSSTEKNSNIVQNVSLNNSNGFSNYNSNMKSERKNLLTLDLTKKIVKKNTDMSSELFSDRPKNNSNSLLKFFSPNNQDSLNFNKNANFTSGNVSQLFRQNNKSSSLKYSELSKLN